MELMLNHVDSPYIRCIGILYLRYVSDPKELWDWLMPYLYDEEPVKIASRHSKEETVGDFVRGLLNDLDYYGTRLPRLPLGLEREIKVKLLQEEQIEQRALKNYKDKQRMEYFQKIGSNVKALYGDEENPTTWYDAVVDRVVRKDDETGYEYSRPRFLVTFPLYGNTEVVTLGEMDIPDKNDRMFDHRGSENRGTSSRPMSDGRYNNHKYEGNDVRDRDHGRDRSGRRRDNIGWNERGRSGLEDYHGGGRTSSERHTSSSRAYHTDWRNNRRSRSRSRDRSSPSRQYSTHSAATTNEKDLMEEVKRRERDKVATNGRTRPGVGTDFSSSQSHTDRRNYADKSRNYSTEVTNLKSEKKTEVFAQAPAKQSTKEDLAAIEEKKRKLLAKYG